jgi:hypothetical protein
VETLHPELIQVDLRQLGAEFSARDRIKLNVRGTNGRLIRKWIGKVENFAPRHFRTPGFTEAEKVAARTRGNAMSGDFLTDYRLGLFRVSIWARWEICSTSFAINVLRQSSTRASCYARKMT